MLDLFIRLMGYGSGISIAPGHKIAKEINTRLIKQRELTERLGRDAER